MLSDNMKMFELSSSSIVDASSPSRLRLAEAAERAESSGFGGDGDEAMARFGFWSSGGLSAAMFERSRFCFAMFAISFDPQ